VGQNRFEEVIWWAAAGGGANFGWSPSRGSRASTPTKAERGAPGVVYSHDQGCSVTGGYVVRDASLESLYGRYL
jgi:hypothetical protein